MAYEKIFTIALERDHIMSKRLNIEQIAAQTGLSMSTVSRVLAGRANTSHKAREAVLACARDLGVLEGMATGRLLLNDVVVFAPQRAFDERADIFYYRVLQAMINNLGNYDVHVSFCPLEEQDSHAARFLEKLSHPRCQAALLLGIDDPHIHDLAWDLAKPCILINCRDRKMRLPSVAPDHRAIGEYAARYLFERGHRQVANLFCLRRYTMEQQLAGICDAWQEQGQTFKSDQALLVLKSFSARESESQLTQWWQALTPRQRPTALLTGGDYVASGAIAALTRLGVSVPQQVSVLSIDAVNVQTVNDLRLTSLQVPREALGEEAVHLLAQRLLRPQAPALSLLLPGILGSGESVQRLRAGTSQSVASAGPLYD